MSNVVFIDMAQPDSPILKTRVDEVQLLLYSIVWSTNRMQYIDTEKVTNDFQLLVLCLSFKCTKTNKRNKFENTGCLIVIWFFLNGSEG